MPLIHLFILSLIQGLTEFLPVSSSGHLVLLPKLTGWTDQGIVIDVAMHVGTLMAILLYYRRDIFNIAFAVLRWNNPETAAARNLGLFIVLGSVPAVLIGATIHYFIPDGIRSIEVIAATTIIFGVLMGVADRRGALEEDIFDVTWQKALLIGCAQAMALIPGTSRSGITMTAARFMGFKRVEAARFSFLLGIPAMFGAGLISFLELLKSDSAGLWNEAAIAVVLAFIFGLITIHCMLKFLQKKGLMPFVVYRLILGVFLIVYISMGHSA